MSTHEIMNKLSPESLWDVFEQRSMHSSYVTRNYHDLQIPRLHTEHGKKGFKCSALKIWNDTPVDIREASTLGCFKKQLKTHLLSDQNANFKKRPLGRTAILTIRDFFCSLYKTVYSYY